MLTFLVSSVLKLMSVTKNRNKKNSSKGFTSIVHTFPSKFSTTNFSNNIHMCYYCLKMPEMQTQYTLAVTVGI